MKLSQPNNPGIKIPLVFILSIVYWIYLLFTARVGVVFDAINYEDLGRMIYHEGWVKYFETGPNREPLYPFLIAISMRIADIFSVSYLYIQKFIQIIILLVTQVLTLKLLRKLEIDSKIIALTILYIGFSPAIVNSAFSLFSEIATYPLILGIIYVAVKAWRSILQGNSCLKLTFLGLFLGVLFILITSTKAIFEFIFPILLLPYLVFIIRAFTQKDKKILTRSTVYILAALLSFGSFLHFFKSMNQKHNGTYAFANRGAWMLYGTVERRTIKMTPKKVLAAISMVPGDGVCIALFGKKECDYWTFNKTMELGVKKSGEIASSGTLPHKIDSKLIELSKQEILNNPIQYGFFHLLEGARMFFWESTQIGFVTYPAWLTKLFTFTPFKNTLRLIIGCFTIASFFYLFLFIFQNKNLLLDTENRRSEKLQICFFAFLIIIFFIQLYSFFCILTRYSFPIVPLYILSMAFLIQKILLARCQGIKKS